VDGVSQRSRSWRFGVVYAAVALAAVAARINPWTAAVCFWNDEAFSWAVARAPWRELMAMVAQDTHPPAHYVLLHLWIDLFGDSIFAMRLLSGLFSAATVGLIYGAAWYGFRFPQPRLRELATTAALLCALNPACASTAYMARMYAPLMFGTALSSLGCLIVWHRPQRWPGWWMWIGGSVLSLYNHNYGLFVVAGEFCWITLALLVRADLRRRWFVARLASAALLVAISYAPWGPVLMGQARRVSGGFWIPPLQWDALAALGAQLFAEPISAITWGPLRGSGMLVLGIALGLLLVVPWFGAAVEWLFVSIVLVHAAGIVLGTALLKQSVFEVRYLLHLVPLAMVALASRAQVIAWKAGRRGVELLLVGLVAASGVATLWARASTQEAVREAAQRLARQVGPGDLVVGDAQCFLRLQYYLEHLQVSVPLAVYAPQLREQHHRLVVYAPALERSRVLSSLEHLRVARLWTVASVRSRLLLATIPGYRSVDTQVLYDRGCADAHHVVLRRWEPDQGAP